MPRGRLSDKNPVSGANLRASLSAAMKSAAKANGVSDQRIDTHSMRAGGANALYARGGPIDLIQRWCSWASLTFRQYIWRDSAALNRLSEIAAESHVLLGCGWN